MNKIKVLYIIDTLEGYGAEKSLVEIASNFRQITPVFVHIYQGDMLKPILENAGIRVYSLDIRKKYAFTTAVKKLKAIYLEEKPDIVHATLFRSEIIARKLKKDFQQIFLVGSFVSNAYSPERFKRKNSLDKLKLAYFQNLDRQSVSMVDQFVSNSQTIKNNTTAALGIEPKKVKVIYRGRKSRNFDPESIHGELPYLSKQNHILLNVSRLIPLKGQLDLLKAMPEIIKNYPQIQLVFAGHGSYRENLERYVRKLGVQDNIRFLGRIDNIPRLLVKADIFLYPSYSEGLPGALIEAMMAEKIIIASNIPENLECVDEDCALIYEKGNILQLVSVILKVLKNPQRFQYLGKNARQMAIQKFELEKIVGEYENYYLTATRGVNLMNANVDAQSKLRILHLIQKPQNRGAETFASQLANHQNNHGHTVKLVSVFSGEANLPWKGRIESLKATGKFRFLDFKAWKKLSQIVKDFKPDIIQANAGDTLKYAVMSKKLHRWETPIIFRNASEVGRYLTSKHQKKINTFFYKNIDAVASVSKASKRDLLQHFPFLQDRCVRIPIGLEKKKIEELGAFSSKIKNIVHVGGFSFEKNHKGLISIFKMVISKYDNVILHLIGDGPLRKDIELLVKNEGLESKVKFYGFVNNPLSYIQAGDVLVLPSIIEGLPGVILEAMYCKTPVIAYNVGGIREIVNGNTGMLIEKNNERKFAEAIINVLNEDNLIRIENAHKLVLKEYLNERLIKDFDNLYRIIV